MNPMLLMYLLPLLAAMTAALRLKSRVRLARVQTRTATPATARQFHKMN